MPAATLVILNPASRSGATGRRWRAIEPELREAIGPFEVEPTRGPRDASRIAREAARSGVERIVVAGGDGTISETASGLLEAGLADEVQLGLLPLGTGGDLLRSVGAPRDLAAAVRALALGKTRRIDTGRLRYRDPDGAERRVSFVNVASFGISGLVDDLVNRAPKWLGGTASFGVGTLRALARHRSEPVRLELDGELVHDGPASLIAVANGGCFGGGMRIAPGARPDDGWLEVVVVPGLGRLRLLANFPSIYRGRHVDHPDVVHRRARRVVADAEPGRVLLDVDGEALGSLPAEIEILPASLTLFGVDGDGEAAA